MAFGTGMKNALMASSTPPPTSTLRPNDLPYQGPLLDAVSLFERLGIAYALIGGVAAMFYGRARFTEDIDFVAAADHMAILAANPEVMKEFNFDPTCQFMLYHSSGLRIDLRKDAHVASIIANAREVPLAGRTVRIADAHDLVAMKLRAGRIKDDYDISEIVRSGEIHAAKLRALTSPEEFAQFEAIKLRTR